MEKLSFKVDGMTCGGCVKSIQNALNEQNGINTAIADLDNASVEVEYDSALIAAAAIKAAIETAGFDVVG
jgi:copper chaperone